MSHRGRENQGTGLRDVFDVLVKAPRERLLSLTFQLGESHEDNIVHALCLIVLQKEERALNKLQMLKINLANHIVEKWQTSGGKLEDFAVNCGNFQEFTKESLALLARIFKVLSEQKLCDPPLRDLAYQRALSSSDNEKTSEDLEYDLLQEEARVVCGPQFAEMMCSPKDLKSGSYCDPLSSLDSGTLKVGLSQDQSESAHSLPSPLQATSSMPSYPTHLEISMPPTALFQDDKTTPETSGESELNALVLEAKNAPEQPDTSQPNSSIIFGANKHSNMDETSASESSKSDSLVAENETPNQTTKPSEPNFALPAATNIVTPMMHESKDAEEEDEEEEAIFYPFVIFHAPEDAEMAESMRVKLQKVIGIEGATFVEDFAIPGRSPLRCVEDAINNSAFTLLLLTRNFGSRMQEMETDSALINSINNMHKYDTVIPLLPRENRMLKQDLPLVLKTILPLEENRNFERNIKKVMTPAKVRKQEKIWLTEQAVKKEKKRQERLKISNQQQKQLIKERTAAQSLEIEKMTLLMAQKRIHLPSEQGGGDGVQVQQPANIHIENANYIMIGNDSQMTVGFRGGPDKDDSIEREEEQ